MDPSACVGCHRRRPRAVADTPPSPLPLGRDNDRRWCLALSCTSFDTHSPCLALHLHHSLPFFWSRPAGPGVLGLQLGAAGRPRPDRLQPDRAEHVGVGGIRGRLWGQVPRVRGQSLHRVSSIHSSIVHGPLIHSFIDHPFIHSSIIHSVFPTHPHAHRHHPPPSPVPPLPPPRAPTSARPLKAVAQR